ncbi:MAG: 3-dehydroquinate synthase [Pseudomonadota bacterium]
MTPRQTVHVGLGDRSYDILIGNGLLEDAGKHITSIMPDAKCAIVTDENVAALHLSSLKKSLETAGLDHFEIVLQPGETTKSYAHLETVVEGVLDARLERNDVVIGFGGGVIGDLAGFAASIIRRGMHFVQVPTTLLAQVDSSVGGKTGINSPHGKNLVGAFHQPKLVIADTSLLDTLTQREFKAGYAEVIKYGLISDENFFTWLEQNWRGIFDGTADRVEAVAYSCRAKAAIVERDERESGERALLNLGHTFGHALEGIARYNPEILVHGEGVAIGMVLAHAFSSRLNHASPDDTDRVRAHLETVGLPADLSFMREHIDDADQLLDFIAQDKKVSRGALTFILTRGIGNAFVGKNVPTSEVRTFLQTIL